jgi:hypothetical protein
MKRQEARKCSWCGEEFITSCGNNKYCSLSCRKDKTAASWVGLTLITSSGPRNYYKEAREKDRRFAMLYATKRSAKVHKVPHDLCLDDIEMPLTCPILGIKIDYSKQGTYKDRFDTPTVDRLIPEKGYVKGNIRTVSHKGNRFKNNMSLEEAELVVKYMKENVI